MHIPVGPHWYRLILVSGYCELDGEAVLGLCDPERQVIEISDRACPEKRLVIAWRRELDVHEAARLGDEPMARLVGLAMARMDARTVARLHVYLTQGIECADVMMSPGLPGPVPVVRLSS